MAVWVPVYYSTFDSSCAYFRADGTQDGTAWGDSIFWGTTVGGVAACETGSAGRLPGNPPFRFEDIEAGKTYRLRCRVWGRFGAVNIGWQFRNNSDVILSDTQILTAPHNTWTVLTSDPLVAPANTGRSTLSRSGHIYWDYAYIERLDPTVGNQALVIA